nr:unnamed protein product [Naegleria fowleri]
MQNTMNVDRNARLSPPFHIFPLMKTIQEANSLSCHSNESNNNNTCSSESYNNLKISNVHQNGNHSSNIVSMIHSLLSDSGKEKHLASLNVLNKDQWFMLWTLLNLKKQVSGSSSTCQLSSKQQQHSHSGDETNTNQTSITLNATENAQFVENNNNCATTQSIKIPSSDSRSEFKKTTSIHANTLMLPSMNGDHQSPSPSFLSGVANEFPSLGSMNESNNGRHMKHRMYDDDDKAWSPLLNDPINSNSKKHQIHEPLREDLPTLHQDLKGIQKKSSLRQPRHKKLPSSKPSLIPSSWMSEFQVRDEQKDHGTPIFIQHTAEMLKQELMIKKGLLPKRPRGRPRKNHNHTNSGNETFERGLIVHNVDMHPSKCRGSW